MLAGTEIGIPNMHSLYCIDIIIYNAIIKAKSYKPKVELSTLFWRSE